MTATTSKTAQDRKARKAPAPRTGLARWVAGRDVAREGILNGRGAELAIRPDGSEGWTSYLLEPVISPAGLDGWRLTRYDEGGAAVYHLPADLSGCDCPDTKYRGAECKHRRAVLAALRAIGLDPTF